MSTTRVSCNFQGRVQGVGFRMTACMTARPFAVTGWVRNEPDGSVRLEVQGEEAEVEAFLAALHERMARNIDSVSRGVEPVCSEETSFDIRH